MFVNNIYRHRWLDNDINKTIEIAEKSKINGILEGNKKMKKIVSTLVAIALSVGFISPAYASGVTSINQKIVYKPYSNSVTTHEEQERIEREYFKAHPEIAANAGAADCIIVNNGATQLLRSVDPGEGSVRIVTSNMYGTGNILWDTEKKASALSAIAGVVMDIWGGTAGTVISVAQRILNYYGITANPDQSRAGEFKAGHSFGYIDRNGDFYTNRNWKSAVRLQQRLSFRHTYAVMSVNGSPSQYALDETPNNGYSAYLTETKPNFNNDTLIRNTTLQSYRDQKAQGYFTAYVDVWM